MYRRPYRTRKKKLIFKKRFFWLSLLILILLFGGSYLFIFSPYFQIKEIKISGNRMVQTRDLQNLIEKKINQRLLFYQIKNIFLVNLDEIKKKISEDFPKIAQVNLKRKFPNSLIVEARERESLFLWCQDSGSCFHLDKEGIIFDPVRNDISNGAESSLIKIKSQGEAKLGKKVIEKEVVDFLQKTQLKLKDLGILTKEFQISEDKITAQTDQGWQIYFNSKEDPERQIFNLSLVLEKEIPPEKRENLEYIDLQFGNRVYYKYKGE